MYYIPVLYFCQPVNNKYSMSILPVQFKPKNTIGVPGRNTIIDYKKDIIELPNLLTVEDAIRLKDFASNKELSGLHRRGSKDEYVNASFYTCLFCIPTDPLYVNLNYVWDVYGRQLYPDLTFIEYYEIKMYETGDVFNSHHDSCIQMNDKTRRKLNLVIQLTDESEYDGGDLMIGDYTVNRTIGSGVLFPADVYHSVTEITRGTRSSLIGHGWGPIN